MISADPVVTRMDLTTAMDLHAHLQAHGPLPRLVPRRGSMPGALADACEQAGLRGRGGGWFPAHVKMRAVVRESAGRSRLNPRRHPVVVANGMEGEPASGKDATLLAAQPHLVLDGLVLAAEAVGATDAVIAVHRGSVLVPALARAIEARAGTASVDIRLVTPPARYVASEESALAHWIGDGLATPVYPDRPFQRGVDGRPTLVQNVETLAHLALIARHGSSWFRSAGVPSAPGTTLVTVGGAVMQTGVIEVETGTSVSGLLERCGGPLGRVGGFLTGGYGGAWVAADDLIDFPWDPESVSAAGGVVGAGVLWVLGDDACPLVEMARVTSWMAGESAGQCGPCLFGLPSLADDVAAVAHGGGDRERLDRRLHLVSGRGGCKHPDGVARFVATGLAAFADEARLHSGGRCSVGAPATAARSLPVPAARDAVADHERRDLR